MCTSVFSLNSSIKNEIEFLDPEHPLTYNTTCKWNNANATLVNLQNVHLADISYEPSTADRQDPQADSTITWNGLMQGLSKNKCVTYCVIVVSEY